MTKMLTAIAAIAAATAAGPPLPAGIARRLPPGYEAISTAMISAGSPVRDFVIVALAKKDEAAKRPGDAPARPLMIFEREGGGFVPVGRNDEVVMAADQGGQCDPFLDGDAVIAAKGRYFTVQNGVACGNHWTDYITFRLDDRAGGFVFDNERRESWKLNPSDRPNAEALVRDGKPTVVRDRPHHVTPFPAWRTKD